MLLACVGWITWTIILNHTRLPTIRFIGSHRGLSAFFFSLLHSRATAISVAGKAISVLLLSRIILSKFTWVSNFRTSSSSWFISGFRWMLCVYNNQWWPIDAQGTHSRMLFLITFRHNIFIKQIVLAIAFSRDFVHYFIQIILASLVNTFKNYNSTTCTGLFKSTADLLIFQICAIRRD